jgi:hypothetical protein
MPWQERRPTMPQASRKIAETDPKEWTLLHWRIKMSIHDFRSKLVSGGERSTLFAALRKLSLLDDLCSLAAAEEAGWPIWDETGSAPPRLTSGAQA